MPKSRTSTAGEALPAANPHPFTITLIRDLALDCVLAIAAAAGFGCGLGLAISLLAGGGL
jgi:hypothetical protein